MPQSLNLKRPQRDELAIDVFLVGNHPTATGVSEAEWERWFFHWSKAIPLGLSPLEAYEVGLTLTNDAAIQRLNADYRQQDQPTDVLSFAALESEFPGPPELLAREPLYLGDIIISIDRAQAQSAEAGHSLRQELAWLAVHGFLHLLGWDHPDDESLMNMLTRQRELLAALGI